MSEFEKKSKELLDEHADSLDGPTLSRLHQMRSNAISRKTRSPYLPYVGWTGAGAVAASLFVAVVYLDRSPEPLPTIYEDPLQQAAAEELELINDLDFYAWMVLEEDGVSDEPDLDTIEST